MSNVKLAMSDVKKTAHRLVAVMVAAGLAGPGTAVPRPALEVPSRVSVHSSRDSGRWTRDGFIGQALSLPSASFPHTGRSGPTAGLDLRIAELSPAALARKKRQTSTPLPTTLAGAKAYYYDHQAAVAKFGDPRSTSSWERAKFSSFRTKISDHGIPEVANWRTFIKLMGLQPVAIGRGISQNEPKMWSSLGPHVLVGDWAAILAHEIVQARIGRLITRHDKPIETYKSRLVAAVLKNPPSIHPPEGASESKLWQYFSSCLFTILKSKLEIWLRLEDAKRVDLEGNQRLQRLVTEQNPLWEKAIHTFLILDPAMGRQFQAAISVSHTLLNFVALQEQLAMPTGLVVYSLWGYERLYPEERLLECLQNGFPSHSSFPKAIQKFQTWITPPEGAYFIQELHRLTAILEAARESDPVRPWIESEDPADRERFARLYHLTSRLLPSWWTEPNPHVWVDFWDSVLANRSRRLEDRDQPILSDSYHGVFIKHGIEGIFFKEIGQGRAKGRTRSRAQQIYNNAYKELQLYGEFLTGDFHLFTGVPWVSGLWRALAAIAHVEPAPPAAGRADSARALESGA